MKAVDITRRQAIKTAVAGAMVPILLNADVQVESEIIGDNDHTPACGSSRDWTPREVARVAAAWELGAQQRNRPTKWRRLRYTGVIQWSDGRDGSEPLVVWYGIGPADWTARKMAELASWLRDTSKQVQPVLAEERIACGRAYAIVSASRAFAKRQLMPLFQAGRKLNQRI